MLCMDREVIFTEEKNVLRNILQRAFQAEGFVHKIFSESSEDDRL